eukprot:14606861-Heterocapsa_arctica.AAC.1
MMKHQKKGSPGQAGTLRNIFAGGTWPQTRLAEVDATMPLICPNCGDHRWYICGAHNGCRVEHEWIRTKAQNELNRQDETTGDIKPQRAH